MAEETLFMLYALLMGIFITFVYDLFRILRRVIPHNIFWISVEDLAFWGFSAVEVFLLMYHVSNGTLRWFAVLGALLGMFLYSKTLSKFLVKYISLLLGKLLKIIGKVLRFVFKPVTLAAGAAKRTAGKAAYTVARGKLQWNCNKTILNFTKKRLTAVKKVITMIICKK